MNWEIRSRKYFKHFHWYNHPLLSSKATLKRFFFRKPLRGSPLAVLRTHCSVSGREFLLFPTVTL